MSGGPGRKDWGSTIDWTELPCTLTNIRVKNKGTESGNLLVVENRGNTVFFLAVIRLPAKLRGWILSMPNC